MPFDPSSDKLYIQDVTLRDGMAYAAVTNRSGASGRMLDVRLAALDRAGEEITWSHSYCMTVEGGTTVLDGAVAHCTWHIRDDQMPASMAVSLDELDPVFDEAPEGFYYVAGEPTYGDAGTSVGWAEATVCSRSRSGSPGLDVIVLDKHGMPWDWGYADEAEVEGDGCRVGRVGGLNLPEKPVIIAHP